MGAASLIGRFLVWSAFAGLVGAGVMVAVLSAINRSGLTKVRLVISVGSLFTRSYERAEAVGWFVHAALGIFFGQIYALVLVAIGAQGVGVNLAWGAGLGLFHGLMMGLVLIGAVSDAHPLEEFQQRSFPIALSYCVAHFFYGLAVGAIIGLSGIVVPH